MTVPTPPSTTLSTPSPTERNHPLASDELDMPAQPSRPIYLVVATSLSSSRLGIGYQNSLPWPFIKPDMAFFQKVTRDSRPPSTFGLSPTAETGVINAVIMGRKTYDSIPPKSRPLAGRLNVVISRTPLQYLSKSIEQRIRSEKQHSDGPALRFNSHSLDASTASEAGLLLTSTAASVITDSATPTSTAKTSTIAPILLSNSLPSVLSVLTASPDLPPNTNSLSSRLDKQIGNISIIGGTEIYSSFLQHHIASQSAPVRILQTELRKVDGSEFECDAFFPVVLGSENSGWKQVKSSTVCDWLNSTLDDGKQIQLPQGDKEWATDDKAGVELKVVGWERGSS